MHSLCLLHVVSDCGVFLTELIIALYIVACQGDLDKSANIGIIDKTYTRNLVENLYMVSKIKHCTIYCTYVVRDLIGTSSKFTVKRGRNVAF